MASIETAVSCRGRALSIRQRDCLPNGRATLLILFVVWTTLTSGCTGPVPPLEETRRSIDIQTPRNGLDKVRDQPEQRFVPATLAELPPEVQAHLLAGAIGLFSDGAMPFGYDREFYAPVPLARPGDAKVRVFAASGKHENDLVECVWQHRGIPIRWVEQLNISVVEFPLDAFQSNSTDSAEKVCLKVQEFLGAVIPLRGASDYNKLHPYEIQLPWPKTLSEGMEFTSNPNIDFEHLARWQDRADVVIEQGRFKFITYHLDTRAMFFLDGSQYFPEDFRKTMLERMHATNPTKPEQ